MADVNTSAFMLSSATVMLGRAFVDDVFSLTPDLHSVGMVSEVSISLESSINELLNGVEQEAVDGRRTNLSTNITANIFEMTSTNFLRAQGLSTGVRTVRRGRLVFSAPGGSQSVSFVSNPVPGVGESLISSIDDIPVGSTLLIQRADEPEYVYPALTTGAATFSNMVYTAPLLLPDNLSFSTGANVWLIDPIGVGEINANDLFCMKIVGTMSAFNQPMVYIAPKVRMVKGFSIGFNETQYTSMAWELKALRLARGEIASAPRLGEVGRRRTGLLLVGAGEGLATLPPPLPVDPDPEPPTGPVTLNQLSLSGSLRVGTASSGLVTGTTSGSTISSSIPGLTINSSARTYAWSGAGTAGTFPIAMIETHPNATNSGRTSSVSIEAAPVVLSISYGLSADGGTGPTAPAAVQDFAIEAASVPATEGAPVTPTVVQNFAIEAASVTPTEGETSQQNFAIEAAAAPATEG